MPRRSQRRRRLRKVAGAAAIAPLLRAGTGGGIFAARAALATRRGTTLYRDVPNPSPSAGLAGAVAVDELFVMPIRLLTSLAPSANYERSTAELDEAVRFYDARGWLDDPAGYFPAPSAPRETAVRKVRRRRGPFEVVRFPSDWSPQPDEPGGDRWRSFGTNREMYAALLRHDDGPRPWLVWVHGQGMGRPGDVETSHARRLHDELGINVALPVLPLHGKRSAGPRPDRQFVSNVYPVNNVLGLGQSMWDLRRLLAWLREEQGAPGVGMIGFSLGSYAASLLSTLDADLACVIAVVPNGDLAAALAAHEPLSPANRRGHRMVHDWRSALAHRVVSPLVRPCLVPKERRFIIAGQGDRVAPPPGAVLLWRHWEEPTTYWRPRGHLTIARSEEYHQRVSDILRSSGLSRL